MNMSTKSLRTVAKLGIVLCSLLSLLLLPGCGVYSKAPPVNPEEIPLWSGPLVQDEDIENVRIYIKPNSRTITLDMEDLDADLRVLLAEYEANAGDRGKEDDDPLEPSSVEELSVNVQSENYVLIIEKTKH